MEYTQEQLKIRLKQAWNYESRDGWGAENLKTWMIGTVKRENKLYDIYADEKDNYWYKVRVITERGIVSEYEAIFGHPERKKRDRRRIWEERQ